MATDPSVGLKIMKYRKEQGKTRQKLAEDCGLSHVAIWKIENLKASPTEVTIRKIATALGVHPSLFFA